MGQGTGYVVPNGRTLTVYRKHQTIRNGVRVVHRILATEDADVLHYFFAPNDKTSSLMRMVTAVRGLPSVQTVCSDPDPRADLHQLTFASRTVVLSKRALRRYVDIGIDPKRLIRIPPCIEPLASLPDDERMRIRLKLGLPAELPLIVYPGDLEFGRGARCMLQAFLELEGAALVMACRAKTKKAAEIERTLRDTLPAGAPVYWLGEVEQIHELLGASDVVALPTETLYAKMDYPLSLLEAMSMQRPVLVTRGTAAEELEEGGAYVTEYDPLAVADGLEQMLSDETLRRSLGIRGEHFVRTECSPSNVAQQYERVYDELCA